MEARRFRSFAKRSEIYPRKLNSKKARTVEDISKVFAKLAFQGKSSSAAIKLFDSESSTGLLNLTPEALE